MPVPLACASRPLWRLRTWDRLLLPPPLARVQVVLGDTSTVSKDLGSDELELERHAFDPTQGLTDLAELARLEAHGDRAVDVELELANDVQLVADRRLFQRAVENVLRNAVQHARGKVLLELSLDEHNVRVAVHDDGPGIPEELRDEVMIPFVRLDADRSRTTGGVGLGLAIVCRIMNRHNGRIEIGTSPLGGATVATLWPRGD